MFCAIVVTALEKELEEAWEASEALPWEIQCQPFSQRCIFQCFVQGFNTRLVSKQSSDLAACLTSSTFSSSKAALLIFLPLKFSLIPSYTDRKSTRAAEWHGCATPNITGGCGGKSSGQNGISSGSEISLQLLNILLNCTLSG